MICLVSFKLVRCRTHSGSVAQTNVPVTSVVVQINIYGEFDPGSGRTLAACLTHASRTVKEELAPLDQWRTGE